MPLTSGTPKWQKIATFVLLGAILLTVLFIYNRAGQTNAAVRATSSASDRRDCVTTLSTARRSVFDDVDIYKAIEIQLLSSALLDSANGIVHTQAEKDALKAVYKANDDQLKMALVEARRLQPAKTLDDLIAHGGTVAGVRYPACPD